MKDIAWSLLGLAAIVAFVAFGLLLAPDAADATEGPGGLLSHLTPRETADLVVGASAALVAFLSGAYLSAQAAAEADDAPEPAVESLVGSVSA